MLIIIINILYKADHNDNNYVTYIVEFDKRKIFHKSNFPIFL